LLGGFILIAIGKDAAGIGIIVADGLSMAGLFVWNKLDES
jgi:hypothetical protein